MALSMTSHSIARTCGCWGEGDAGQHANDGFDLFKGTEGEYMGSTVMVGCLMASLEWSRKIDTTGN